MMVGSNKESGNKKRNRLLDKREGNKTNVTKTFYVDK